MGASIHLSVHKISQDGSERTHTNNIVPKESEWMGDSCQREHFSA